MTPADCATEVFSSPDSLGDIPDRWQVLRLKDVSSVIPPNVDKKSYDGQSDVRLCNYKDVYYNETITHKLELMVTTASPEEEVLAQLRRDGHPVGSQAHEPAFRSRYL